MKILEVRDGFIKVEIEAPVELSSFLLIDSFNKKYIAQVCQIKKAGATSFVYAKILFLYNDFEKLIAYDDTLPSLESNVCSFSQAKLFQDKYSQQILSGKFADDDTSIHLSKTCFDKNLYISFENKDTNNVIVSNLVKQFIQMGKVVIIDTLGFLKGNKYFAGKDFKLPLNSSSLSFMYEDCLNDATQDSKSLIKEIFKSLSEYSETVPFVPFDTLKTIVDDMVDKTHEFKLLVLKNKLAKFHKLGYFATSKEEALNLSTILKSDCAIIDLSKLDSAFLNRYIKVIYEVLNSFNNKPQVFIELSNLVDKKSLKSVITSEVSTTFITHSQFKYSGEIKSMFDNFIIEPSFTNNQNFNDYGTFLKNMQADKYLVVGKDTYGIPLISKLTHMEAEILPVNEEEKNEEEKNEEEKEPETETEKLSYDEVTANDENNTTIIETSEQTQAINEKSEKLIEEITVEVENDPQEQNTDLFEDDSNDDTVDSDEVFHTQVDTTQTIEVSEEISDMTEDLYNEDNEDNEVNEDNNDIIEIDNSVETIENDDLADDNSTIIVENSSDEIIDENELDTENYNEEEIEEISEDNSLLENMDDTENIEDSDDFISEDDIVTDAEQEDEFESDDSFIEENLETDVIEDESTVFVDLEENNLNSEETESGNDDFGILSEDNDLEQEIIEDVDKVYTTVKNEDESLSDTDLDFIDELNGESQLEEIEGIEQIDSLDTEGSIEVLEEIPTDDSEADNLTEFIEDAPSKNIEEDNQQILEKKDTATPIVPVYEADIPEEDIVSSDNIEPQDLVYHAKFGNGVVEKMVKYGTKSLYLINFSDFGRKLLDPTLTEIKKV